MRIAAFALAMGALLTACGEDALVAGPADATIGANSSCVTGACDDGNPCTADDKCAAGLCLGTALACSDGNPCTADACEPKAGACLHPPAANATCDDGNLCTTGEQCQAGACAGGLAKSCDDGDTCTQDACTPGTGLCGHTPTTAPCSDGNACTNGDLCSAGKCQGAPLACDDGKPCTADGCDPKTGCTQAAAAATCDDGNACTQGDSCAGGLCVAPQATVCDDKNACTTDTCDATQGCVFTPGSGSCDDGNPCTKGDVCAAGACKAGSNACECATNVDCAAQDDGNLCNGKLICDPASSACIVDSKTPVTCAAPIDDCQTVACEPKTGKCVTTVVADGAPCDADGSLCTQGDACKGGGCALGKAAVCNDGNPCTQDTCKGAIGCVFTPGTGACDADGNACTVGDACADKLCEAGPKKACDDGNPCTQDSCGALTGACGFDGKALDDVPCNADGSVCSVGDACQGGSCQKGKTLDCDDKNPCTADSCDATAGCKQIATAGSCSDGNACTLADACQAGACTSGLLKACPDGDKCTEDGCDESSGTCTHKLLTGCSKVCSKDGDCDDGNPCTDNTCESGKCESQVKSGACDDGSVCTGNDACQNGVCQGQAKTCSDGKACTADSCDAKLGCQFVAASGPCDADGNACTAGDFCQDGGCKVGAPKNCSDGNPCTADACNPQDGACGQKAQFEGDPCDADGSLCTVGDACKAGVCSKGATLPCDDGNACTADSCLPQKGCVSAPASGACEDGKGCTVGDACQNGVCQAGSAKVCDDGKACTADTCDAKTGSCVFTGIAGCANFCAKDSDCDDGNGCTDDVCQNGNCVAKPHTKPCSEGDKCFVAGTCGGGTCQAGQKVDCDDANPCTDNTCQPKTGLCVFAASTAPCQDGNACTLGDGCKNGKCLSGAAKVCDDKNGCTDDACNVQTGACSFTPSSKACDDANLCTTGEFCQASVCAPATLGTFEGDVGTGVAGFADGPATKAQFQFPQGLVRRGSAYVVADLANHRIRLIAQDGTVSTLAGSGGVGQQNGPAGQATFQAPSGVAVTADGTVYVADSGNHVIRKISLDGVVTTIAGSGKPGLVDGKGGSAQLHLPAGITSDGKLLFITETGSHTVRQVSTDGVVTTLAGGGKEGYADGAGKKVLFTAPAGIVVGPGAAMWVADAGNHRIRKVTYAGVVTTVAGSGVGGFQDGAALAGKFLFPVGVAFAPGGELVIADRQNHRVRALSASGQLRTIAGDGSTQLLDEPFGLAFDGAGRAWITDLKNQRVRRLRLPVTVCEDGNSCTLDACDAKTGSCQAPAVSDGKACGDGCQEKQVCTAGQCGGGTPKNCNDYVDCTLDSCSDGVCKYVVPPGCMP